VPHVEYQSSIDASAEDLFAWHARPGAFERLTPPWLPITLERFEGIQDGQRAVIRLGYGPASIRWVAEHFDYIEGEQFCDRQIRGPFEAWTHVHRMAPEGPEASTLIDAIDYELPLGGLGDLFGSGIARDELDRQFTYRHHITAQDLELHQQYNPAGRSLTVAVSGASGLIGQQLTAFLTTGGHTVKQLTRSRPVGDDQIYWNPREQAIEGDKLNGVDAVIHLAGENVFALRWTEAKKDSIMHSRRVGTRLIAEALAGLDNPPDVFLSASAVGYYGDHGTEPITEDTAPSSNAGFLSDVCQAWEAATQPAAEAGIRTAQLRTGIVLTPAGGALQLMLPAFRLGLGGRIGAPNQYFPWIALDDVIGGYVHALWTDTVEGPVNLTAPEPATMDAYAKTLAGVLNRPALLNVPGSAVRTALGEVADEMLLQSARVRPDRLQATGYTFRHPALRGALRHLLGKSQ
jgi:hypothetical protein